MASHLIRWPTPSNNRLFFQSFFSLASGETGANSLNLSFERPADTSRDSQKVPFCVFLNELHDARVCWASRAIFGLDLKNFEKIFDHFWPEIHINLIANRKNIQFFIFSHRSGRVPKWGNFHLSSIFSPESFQISKSYLIHSQNLRSTLKIIYMKNLSKLRD